MNNSHTLLSKIGEVVNAFRISFGDKDHERRSINNSLVRKIVPVSRNEIGVFEAGRISFYRQDCNVGADSLKNLVSNSFGTSERRCEGHLLSVFRFPFCGELGIDGLLQGFFHDRESVNCKVEAAAALRWRLGQTTAQERAQQQEGGQKDPRSKPGCTLPHEDKTSFRKMRIPSRLSHKCGGLMVY